MAKTVKKIESKPPDKKFRISLPVMGKRIYAIIIFCAAFALYFNSIFNNYNLDDELVTNNQAVTSQGWKVVTPDFSVFSNVQLSDSSLCVKIKYFLPPVFRSLYYQDKSGYKYEYRPLAQASFAVEHALFAGKDDLGVSDKDNPHISHLINVILYALTCVLLFLMLARLLSSFNIIFPFIATLLFVAHPIHTEVVDSIKNRDEIMALMFALLSGICALKFAERQKLGYLLLVALAFLLSLLSKPTSITFAMLMPLALIMFSSTSFIRIILVAAVMAALAAFYSRFFFVKQQVVLLVLLLFAVSLAYSILHYRDVLQKLKSVFNTVIAALKFTNTPLPEKEDELNFGFLRRPWITIVITVSIFLMIAVAYIAAHQRWYWLSCLVGLIFAVAYIFQRGEAKVILITPVSLVLFSQIYNTGHHLLMAQVALLLFLAHLMFSGNKYARITAILNYILFVLLGHFVFHTGPFYLFLPLAVVGFYYQRLLPVSIIMFILSLWNEVHVVRHFSNSHRFNLDMLSMPLLQAGILLNWRGKKLLFHRLSVLAIPVLVMVYVSIQPPPKDTDLIMEANHAVVGFNHLKAVDPTPVQSTVRPLKYVEFPLVATDSYSRRLGLAAEVLFRYLKLVIVPYPMSYYYGYAYITPKDITGPLPLFSLLLYVLIALVAIAFYWRKPLVSYALLFYLISISVYTNIIAPIPGVMADRFLLVPSIGFCLIVAWGLFAVFKQNITGGNVDFNVLSKPFKYTLLTILTIYSLTTLSRNMDWKDHLTLFRHDISIVESSAQAQNLLAVQLVGNAGQNHDPEKRKELAEEAVVHFKKALEIYPDFVNSSFDLGRTYELLGKFDEAYLQYAHTSAIDTTFTTPVFYMAVIQHNKGNYQAAIPLYEKYIRKNPLQIQAYANLSYAYFQLKDYNQSVAVNRRALAVSPVAFAPMMNIGKIYIAENKPDSALMYFQMAHKIRPDDNDVNNYIIRFSKK